MSRGTWWRNYVIGHWTGSLKQAVLKNRFADMNRTCRPVYGVSDGYRCACVEQAEWMWRQVWGSPPAMTSGSGNNAPTVTGSAPQNGESKPPPQAVVKPQILTHVIEGFVIQEVLSLFQWVLFISIHPAWVFKLLFSVSGSCIIMYHSLHLVNCCVLTIFFQEFFFIMVR